MDVSHPRALKASYGNPWVLTAYPGVLELWHTGAMDAQFRAMITQGNLWWCFWDGNRKKRCSRAQLSIKLPPLPMINFQQSKYRDWATLPPPPPTLSSLHPYLLSNPYIKDMYSSSDKSSPNHSLNYIKLFSLHRERNQTKFLFSAPITY